MPFPLNKTLCNWSRQKRMRPPLTQTNIGLVHHQNNYAANARLWSVSG